MSDHAWVLENVASYLAGGLNAGERERLEAHAASCENCRAALDESRAVDREMDALFAGARPQPGLEDRVIQSLRTAPERRSAWRPIYGVPMGIAAAVLMGILGAIVTGSIDESISASPAEPPLASEVKQPPSPRGAREMANNLRASMEREIARKGIPQDKPAEEQQDDAGIYFPEAKESDHNESEDYHQLKGDSKDFLSYLPGEAEGREARKFLAEKSAEQSLYKYRNDAPAAKPAAPLAEYFKPGDAAAAPPAEPEKKSEASDPARDEWSQIKKREKRQEEKPAPQRKIIRSGEMEFEIEGFDSTVAKITSIVDEEGGFVGTVNSEKLSNGKVRGTVVVRVPPDRLDTLILKLRALGELKRQHIGSQDVTKQYTDLESQLRAFRAIEERLLNIIKTGKGEIKDLLEAEKQLGEYRVKIEQVEGELRYYGNLISLSTLTITLYEKDIKTPATATETENVAMGLETEDVEKAYKDALAAIADAKGRVTKSDLKKYDASQMLATICCEVSADASGPLRDRLQQLGKVSRLDITRAQTTDGRGLSPDLRVKKSESIFAVSIYNLANVAPRETVAVSIAAADAEETYKAILARISRAEGRVVSSSLNRDRKDQSVGNINFEIRAADADAVLADIKAAGEVVSLVVSENPDTQNVTKSKRGFQLSILALGMVDPRETTAVVLATRDVAASYRSLQEAAVKAGAIVYQSQLSEGDPRRISAQLTFDVRRQEEKSILAAMSAAGVVYSRHVARVAEGVRAIDGKVRLNLSLISVDNVPPRETTTLGIEVGDVDRSAEQIFKLVAEAKGRTVEQNIAREADGRVTARLVFDVPFAAGIGTIERIKATGTVRAQQITRNQEVPETELATARISITLSNAELIIPADGGFGSKIRSGLSAGFAAIGYSLMFVIVGVLVVLPWALAIWGAYRLILRLRRKPVPSPGATA